MLMIVRFDLMISSCLSCQLVLILQSRDFTYVDDIANGTILALKPVGYKVLESVLAVSQILLVAPEKYAN